MDGVEANNDVTCLEENDVHTYVILGMRTQLTGKSSTSSATGVAMTMIGIRFKKLLEGYKHLTEIYFSLRKWKSLCQLI